MAHTQEVSRDLRPHKAGMRLILRVCQCWELYLFLIIPVAWLIIFSYLPMAGVQIAFKKFTLKQGIWGSPWVGIYQFEKFFNSPQLMRVLPNTIILSFYSLIASFPLPIIFALGLNVLTARRYKKVIQTITYLPHFISTVILVGMLFRVFHSRTGLYGIAYQAFTGVQPADLFGNANAFRHLYVWSGVWQGLGWSSIIYVAALSNVSMDLHEAAQIDGATRLKRVWHIDLPTILPTATIMLILNAGSIMNVGFEKTYLLQNDLNLVKSEVISTYVYKVGISSTTTSDYSYSTAISFFNSIVNLLMLMTVNFISGKLSETSLW